MFPLQRRVGMLILITLLITPVLLYAQEDTTITSVGSGIAGPALQALVEASGTEAAVDFQVTGTNSGFAALCAGEADLTTATRAITSAENNACQEAGAAYMKGQELLISVDLGLGRGKRTIWTCDLTSRYIEINADYRS